MCSLDVRCLKPRLLIQIWGFKICFYIIFHLECIVVFFNSVFRLIHVSLECN